MANEYEDAAGNLVACPECWSTDVAPNGFACAVCWSFAGAECPRDVSMSGDVSVVRAWLAVRGRQMRAAAPEPERWGVWCEHGVHAARWLPALGPGTEPLCTDEAAAKAEAANLTALSRGDTWRRTYTARPLPAEGKAPMGGRWACMTAGCFADGVDRGPDVNAPGGRALICDDCWAAGGLPPKAPAIDPTALARALFATDERVQRFATERSENASSWSGEGPGYDAIVARAWERGAAHEPEAAWRLEAEARAAAVAGELARKP